MNYSKTFADVDVPALSVQFEARYPRKRDDRLQPTETEAEHVARAIDAWLDAELSTAQKIAADDAIRTAEVAKDDVALASALLVRHKMDQAAR